jgi:hypothetical protein
VLFRARFLTCPDLDSSHFELREGLTLGGEIDFPHEGTRWRLVEIESASDGEPATLIFVPVSIARAS